jgi:type VI secretion system protein ImpM
MALRKAFHSCIKRIGYFGKVPSVGDFVSRNLTASLREGFDGWLQQGLDASKQQLKDSWLNAFLTSPVWRLVLDRQFEPDAVTVGIMIPSVDKVGRYFPFCIFIQMERIELDAAFMAECDAALDTLENLVLSVLEPDFDVEYFDYQLAAAAKKIMAAHDSGIEQGIDVYLTKANTGFLDPDKSAQLNSRISSLKDHGGSIWWSEGSDFRSADIHFYDSMPIAATFAAFLRDSDVFSDLEMVWDHVRDLGVSQSNNPSVDFGGSGDGFHFHVIAHHGRNQTTNTGYAAAISNSLNPKSTTGVILSDGQFGIETSAMVSRVVCRKLPDFLSASTDPVLNLENTERLSAFLQSKLPNTQQVRSLSSFGFCCAFVVGSSAVDVGQPPLVHIVCTDDYVCFLISNGEFVTVFGNEVNTEGPTVRRAKNNLFKSITLNPKSKDRLFIGHAASTFPELPKILVDVINYPSPQDAARSIMQDAMISGKQGNITVSILDFW